MSRPAIVSIIVPCYNEEATIHQLLDAVLAQTYPREKMEVVISDGFSTDNRRARRSRRSSRDHAELSVRVVDNKRGQSLLV
jgi:glycosyltransferase involved in cell wall biosynthesis